MSAGITICPFSVRVAGGMEALSGSRDTLSYQVSDPTSSELFPCFGAAESACRRGGTSFGTRTRTEPGRVGLDDAVARIEEAITPLDEDGVDRWICAHGGLLVRLEVEGLAHALPFRSDMSSAKPAARSIDGMTGGAPSIRRIR